MASSTTLSVRISTDLVASMERLAAATRRSKSFLAAEAIEAYVQRELPIVEEIERGLEDMSAGRLVPHEDVEAEVYTLIERAEAARKRA
jgi:predicted transcriptional regulator